MKRLFSTLSVVILALFIVSCGNAPPAPMTTVETPEVIVPETSENETPAETPEEPSAEALSIDSLYPFTANVEKVFEGNGNEFAAYVEYVDYIQGDKIQIRSNNGGTEVVKVITKNDDEVKVVYEEAEVYYKENFLDKASNTSEILLKAPIAVGTTWNNGENEKSTITALDKMIKTPYGELKAVEVTTISTVNGDQVQTLNYYAKGLGLVYTMNKASDYEISSSLKEYNKDTSRLKVVNFYYPNVDEKITLFRKNLEFKTNDIPRNLILDAYKDVPENVLGVLTKNTIVNYLYLNKDGMVYVDLSKDFITEMNLGSGYEMLVLQALTNTLGDYYGASKVILTIDGETYESGHILLEKFEPLEVNYDGVIDMN
ncbi:MAG: GerMN domain-containing protein [Clostridiaceae bacterium]